MAQLDNRPLFGTIDQALFVDPPLMPRLIRAVEHQLNVLLLGAPGSGKTSLLHRLAAEKAPAMPRVYVDLGPAENAAQTLTVVAEALEQHTAGQAWGNTLRSTVVPPSTPSSGLLRLVRQLGSAPPHLILADSPPGHGEAHAIFGRLRDELWQLPHRWVVAANASLRDELTRPPAGAFFDAQLDLDPWPEDHQHTLLQRRLLDEKSVNANELVGKTDGLPRSIITLAREAFLAGGSPDEALARRARLQAQLDRLPATARAIADYLAAHGATSGSDPRLLGTLGVTGQRARQVLRALEEAGLVRSFAEQQHEQRQGRPRKLYELVDEARDA
jgi:DNA-binding transcriptional ArsR family regulator